jgi:hypothetical protein
MNFRSLQHNAKIDFKIEISQFNQQKKEENTCELFQYQTDFTKLSENI